MTDPMNTTANEALDALKGEPSTLDKLTGTTAADRKAFIAQAQETLSEAVTSAIEAVKENPKTAAAIAAGATAAVAGAAYGATKLAKTTTPKPRRAPTKRAPAAKATPKK